MRYKALSIATSALLIAGCGKDSSGPSTSPEAAQAIARFTYLADSLTAAGDEEGAQVFTGAADAVRMSGDISTVSISVDGAASEYNALTLSIHVPAMSDCDEFDCYEAPAMDENVLLAWREEVDPSVMFIATGGTGTHTVKLDTTSTEPPEEIATGIALYGSESGDAWVSSEGTATNTAVSTGSACAQPKSETPGVRFTCTRSTYRWSANFTAVAAETEDEHAVVIGATNISGARVVISDMGTNAAKSLGTAPIRTRLVNKRDRLLGLK